MVGVPDRIQRLVDDFQSRPDHYVRNPDYNETEPRVQLINPLFEALGWDVSDTTRTGEVKHEFKLTLPHQKHLSAPDYAFQPDGRLKYFVEAKRPSVDLNRHHKSAYQLRRYAWTANLPVSILTDFEQFAVYDTRARPYESDPPDTARLRFWHCSDYPLVWDELTALFSRTAVLSGSLERLVETEGDRRRVTPVDREFLKQLNEWRTLLATALAANNPDLDQRALNFAVQQTLDRILFLRIAEDRGIEPFDQLRGLATGAGTYQRLLTLFHRADSRYNSGLFHFGREKGRSRPDTLTPHLRLDDTTLRHILHGLYEPHSPYEFAVFPADLLGQVYEQFLGQVITLATDHTGRHHATVQDKPAVRKAGGVFYTPTHIVHYIVRETLGRLLQAHKADPTGPASRIRCLDPACGSGSFLLGAYQHLLDWHLQSYSQDPARWSTGRRRTLEKRAGDAYALTLAERKRILLDNIFGVDIDAQAVEVTKLSLLLKLLEGSSPTQLELFAQRILPDLDANIKCGNSLIKPGYSTPLQPSLLDEDELLRVNAFDWATEFPAIMRAGGFDVVIGNPPYVRPHNLEPSAKEYFWQHYKTFVKKADLYCCFIEKGIELLKPGGQFGYIVSNGWLRLDSFEELRNFLLRNARLHTIIDFTGYVFASANVRTALLLASREDGTAANVQVATIDASSDLNDLRFNSVPQRLFTETYKSIIDLSLNGEQDAVKRQMWHGSTKLGACFELSFGLKTGDDSRFLTLEPGSGEHKRLLRGADIGRYSSTFRGEYVWYVPSLMRQHRKTARPGTADRFEQPKVLIRDTGGGLFGTYDDDDYYVKDVIVVSSPTRATATLKYLTGILNSSLMRFYYETSFPTLHVQRDELASLPIRAIDFTNPTDLAHHDQLVALTDQMLTLHRRLAAEQNPQVTTILQRQIEATDRQIDTLVYALYGLTENEIAIVEQAGNTVQP